MPTGGYAQRWRDYSPADDSVAGYGGVYGLNEYSRSGTRCYDPTANTPKNRGLCADQNGLRKGDVAPNAQGKLFRVHTRRKKFGQRGYDKYWVPVESDRDYLVRHHPTGRLIVNPDNEVLLESPYGVFATKREYVVQDVPIIERRIYVPREMRYSSHAPVASGAAAASSSGESEGESDSGAPASGAPASGAPASGSGATGSAAATGSTAPTGAVSGTAATGTGATAATGTRTGASAASGTGAPVRTDAAVGPGPSAHGGGRYRF